jgi:predicted outer membrane repeat protein
VTIRQLTIPDLTILGRRLVFAAMCLACSLPAWQASAGTIVVRPDGSGDFPTIQIALDEAGNNDVIQLARGTYRGPGNGNLDFLGLKIILRGDPANPGSRVIDCAGSRRGDEIQRAIHMENGEGRGTVVEGITFVGSQMAANHPLDTAGGLVLCRGASPIIRDCVFRTGRAYSGGAIRLERSNAEITRCRFENNSAEMGGAVMVAFGAPVLKDCRFQDNHAARGGAVYSMLADMVITACTFETNTATLGGAIACEERSRLLLDRSVLTDNHASYGGGVELAESDIEMNHCTLAYNSGGSGGALLLRGESGAKISYSILAFSPRGQGIAGVLDAELSIKCTLVYGNADGDWIDSATEMVNQNDNLREDPGFVDAAGGNFSLRSDSPGRDPICGVLGALP